MDDFDDLTENEVLYDLVQYGGDGVNAIASILKHDLRERVQSGEPDAQADPAYLLGVVYMALQELSPGKHTFDEQKLQQRRMLHECGLDVLRLKAAWLEKYPHLKEGLENRRRAFPVIKGGKPK